MKQFTSATLSMTAMSLVLAVGTGLAPVAASAQVTASDESTKLEDIVVTARKRAESIDTVPLAITAMGSEKIESRNLKSLEDVASFSPGFFVEQSTATGTGRNDRSFRQLSFRGVGAVGSNIGIRAGGVAFVDGSPVLNSGLANVQDLERVEVLRGPQAAYFGRSTFIGAVNYVTKDPTDTWTGRLTGEYAEDNLVDLSAAVSGPLTDWASIRISGRHYSKNGQYITSNGFRRVGDQSTNSVAITLLLKPVDGLKIRTTFNHFEDSDGPPAQYVIGGGSAGVSNCNLGGPLGAYWCGVVPQKPNLSLVSANLQMTPAIYDGLIRNTTNIPVPFSFVDYLSDYGLRRKADQFSTKIDYEIGDSGITLTSVTAYHEEHVATLSDFSFRGGVNPTNGLTIGTVTTAFGYRDYDWSQELRLVSSQKSRFRWVVGGNYLKMYQPSSYIISTFFGSILNFGARNVGFDKAETPAAFGGLYFDIVPNLTISAEGRYQEDKVSGKFFTSATAFQELSRTYKSFSPRVSLDYKLTPTSTIYALYSRGTKPGGFNGTSILTATPAELAQLQAALPTAGTSFNEEKLDNFEAGIKGSFLNGRLRFALDGYIGKYKGAQVPIPVTVNRATTPPSVVVLSPVINIGDVDLKGIEFEGEAFVLPGFRVGATFAWTSTKIKNYFCAECSNILPQNAPIPNGVSILPNSVNFTAANGKRLPGAPEISFTLSANYEHKFVDGSSAYIGADYIYRGQYYADAANIASSGASKLFNARIGARMGNYNLELFARNLFNNQSPGITYASLGITTAPFVLPPANTLRVALPDLRRIGVRVSMNF